MKKNDIESAHANSLNTLFEEFGPGNEMSIQELYQAERLRLEDDAHVTSFIPMLACNATRSAMKKGASNMKLGTITRPALRWGLEAKAFLCEILMGCRMGAKEVSTWLVLPSKIV